MTPSATPSVKDQPSNTTGELEATYSPTEIHDCITEDDWYPAIQLEQSLTVLANPAETTLPEARGLLTAMAVRPNKFRTYDIHDNTASYTADLHEKTCNCGSISVVMGGRCKHLWHLHHRNERGLLPSRRSAKGTTGPENKAVLKTTTAPITCEHCNRPIGATTHTIGSISTTTCNVCALNNSNIYNLSTPRGHSKNLTYFGELVCNGTARTYYPETSSMNVYELFELHPNVSPTDSVVIVHPRADHDQCDGLLFNTERKPVPSSVLKPAVQTLHDKSIPHSTTPDGGNQHTSRAESGLGRPST
jgi:hypothetical protein